MQPNALAGASYALGFVAGRNFRLALGWELESLHCRESTHYTFYISVQAGNILPDPQL